MNVFTLWMTGLSGAGKTTLAQALSNYIKGVVILDGDEVRKGLNSDLGFDDNSRNENIRRLAEVAKLFNDNKHPVIVSAITPFNNQRDMARSIIKSPFKLCYVQCPIETCENRDVKGLYKKYRDNKIKNFTGLDSIFDIPNNADIVVSTNTHSIDECMSIILDGLGEYHI
jgi:adenylylsulfate kinase